MTSTPTGPIDPATKEELEAVFGPETHYGSRYDEHEELSVMPDGNQTFACTSWAGVVRRALGSRAVIVGFAAGDNPASEVSALADGHDFAIVDSRFIVDGWILNVECLAKRAVFDLDDPADAPDIERLYGDRKTWAPLLEFTATIDAERPAERAAYNAATGFVQALETFRAAPSIRP